MVDDDAYVARALARMLKKYCQVQVASSVDEAEALVESGADYELILCDVLLPDRQGSELYLSLAQSGSPLAARLAFMTGLGGDAEEASEFSQVPCLGKPIALGDVQALLQRRA